VSIGCTYCTNKVAENADESKPELKTVAIAGEDIPYTIARNYFVLNDYKKGDLVDPKITSLATFNKYFGMATTMGEEGKPTDIDFSKQYVIPVIGELSDRYPEIEPVSLKQKDGQIFVNYKITEGEKSTAIFCPLLLFIVDNKYEGEVKLVKN
jgi:hypothetical protein